MKITMKAAILLLSMTLMGVSHVALAENPCVAGTDMVTLAINDATFNGKRADMDRSNMLQKVQAAISKINEEKYSDAIGKLIDISEKANALADSPKQKLEDAAGINLAVLDATVCINGI